ncbi:MAG: hypothetical protein MO853_08465 [Candidatus Protistobacter heckmanni]|nr:hypothetical protein [Candidatus Protistobacter heckmanni]
MPDHVFSEAVAAFIEVRAGHQLDAEGVIEDTRSRIAGYKKPKYIYFVEQLPRNALGKVVKTDLRALALANVSG